MSIETLLGRVSGGEDLTVEEMTAAVDGIMDGEWTEQQIGLLLTALRTKGETIAEIAGAAAALRTKMTPIASRHRDRLLDTCGTGGDASGTFNISTAAALVVAAAGVPVAKHGNRNITSKSGSANVLAELGVNIEASLPTVERCLDELGIAFCFAPLHHPSMKHVAAVRRQLGVPTIFNILGPLCNPASAPYQLLGVSSAEIQAKLAAALQQLGTRRAMVVHGEDGLDEVTLSGRTQVLEVTPDEIRSYVWQPEDFGVARTRLESLRVDGPRESASLIRRILAGEPGPPRDIVILNAAAAILVSEAATEPREAAAKAAAAIDRGDASNRLERLAELSSATRR